MLYIFGQVITITWLIFEGIHTHDFPENIPHNDKGYYQYQNRCRCGAAFKSEVVTEPCPHSDGDEVLLSCACSHGEWRDGPIIEFHPDFDTGIYQISSGVYQIVLFGNPLK